MLPYIYPKRAICGDICKPLIEFWNLLKSSPRFLTDGYEERWTMLQNRGYTFFYEVRDRFNSEQNPVDLLFISRTCVNGLIRFNSKGKFNNSLHHTRAGILPGKLAEIIFRWHRLVRNVEFVHGDYAEVTGNPITSDFIYLDPPYFNTVGRYYGRIDFDRFIHYLQDLNDKRIRFALSLDGIRENKRFIVNLPANLFKRHFLIEGGNSTFRKVMYNSVEEVKESLYINYDEPTQELASYVSIDGPSSLSSSEANLVRLNSVE